MELLIWAGGRWRLVCPTTGRVEGWRRRARLACNRRGVLRELPPLSALASIIKGPALPRIKKPKVKPVPEVYINTHTGSPYKSFKSAIAVQTITVQKDACIQTDAESTHLEVSKTIHNKTRTTPSNTITSQDKDKESKGIKRTGERNFRSASTEILELRTNSERNNEKIETHKNNKEKNVNEDADIEKAINNDVQKTNRNTESTASSEDKELIIGEQDVLTLRKFIETHDTSIDLYRFDADEHYKTLVFYKINPLVRIERYARIADMVKERHVHFTVHFARQLGLRSVNDSAEDEQNIPKKKYRAAKRAAMSAIDGETNQGKARKDKKTKKNVAVEDSSSESEPKNEQKTLDIGRDQENSKTFISRTRKKVTRSIDIDSQEKRKSKKHTAEEVNISEHEKVKALNVTKTDENGDGEPKVFRKRNQIESNVSDGDEVGQSDEETFKLSTFRDNLKLNGTKMTQDNQDQDARKKPAVEKDIQPKNRKKFDLGQRRIIIPKRSSVRPGREYSKLEDQAIVCWISAATQRERAVNGNKIWKELEGGYTNITGQTRSWHSLRNRYLRYILPGLGALAIPTAQAQRLRAHAARGELKAHKKRRNAVFQYPAVRSASARAPRPAPRPPPPTDTQKGRSSSDSSESEISESDPPKRRRLRSSIRTKSPRNTRLPPNKSDNRTQSSNEQANRKQSPSKALQPRSPKSSPTYSELTRRFALRNRSTPHPSPKPSSSQHKRRLYNPHVPTSP